MCLGTWATAEPTRERNMDKRDGGSLDSLEIFSHLNRTCLRVLDDAPQRVHYDRSKRKGKDYIMMDN